MRGLLVDDDALYLRTLQRSLARRGHDCIIAPDARTALAAASSQPPDFALLDLKLGSDSGLSLIAPLRALRPDMRIILVTGYASVATAVEAIKRGADDYLPKPASADAILRALGGKVGEDAPASGNVGRDSAGMTPLRRHDATASAGVGAHPAGASGQRR